MREYNGKGVNRALSEELFQADETRTIHLSNVHNSYFDGYRYHLNLPPSWQNTMNKRIAVRRIDTPARDYALSFLVKGQGELNTTLYFITQEIKVFIPSSYSMAEALSAILVQSRKTPWLVTPEIALSPTPELHIHYEANTVTMQINSTQMDFRIAFSFENILKFLNVSPNDFQSYFINLEDKKVFNNVWNRKVLFLHASFVSDTTAGYLGRGGEFYPKPSKMYKHDNSPHFFIETSFDGYNKVPLYWENWILELTLIHDAEEYQSP
jgi:hypothetical protein